uniref:Uncharacterized protein n=1 Tax=Knufia peltigerae TaxID=1002370 RepID=A0AA38Y0V1_9EURO|nr:hypothetical protein H2204_008146 [Knufia peltigerae]
MIDQMKFELPGKPAYWIAAGILCALTGLGMDMGMSGTVLSVSEPAKWGGFGALIGTSVGLMAGCGALIRGSCAHIAGLQLCGRQDDSPAIAKQVNSAKTGALCAGSSPIQLPVADGLSKMRGLDGLAFGQIGNGACHPQDAMHRPRRQLQALDGVFQQVLVGFAQTRARTQGGGRQVRVEATTRLLPRMCRFHPRTYAGAGLAQGCALAQLHRIHAAHVDVQVDAVQQRARYPRAVAGDALVAAQAAVAAVAGPAGRVPVT